MDAQVGLPYPCHTILFRAIPDVHLLDKHQKPKKNCFYRRENSDPRGISLFSTIQACKDSCRREMFGVQSVHVGHLYDLPSGLWLFPDDNDLAHANIRFRDGQLTPRVSDNLTDCQNIGRDLMSVSRIVEFWRDDNADQLFQDDYAAKRAARQAQQ